MKPIAIKELDDNFIETIGKEWMLVTAGRKGSFNTMTASWGGIGYLWNKPVVFVFVRPERYTWEFVEREEFFTLSFLGKENAGVHKVCGFKSGRDTDKIKETGLTPLFTEKGNVLFEQSRLGIECRKLYRGEIRENGFLDENLVRQWYGGAKGGFHQVYVAEITGAWVNG